MKARTLVRIATGLLILSPLVVSSTPPVAPPTHGFVFSGRVERTSAGSEANYTVVPLAWVVDQEDPVKFGCALDEYFPHSGLDLTNSNGEFTLLFWTCEMPETLAVAVLSPDTLIVGDRVPMKSLLGSYQVIQDSYTRDDGGCGSDPVSGYRDIGHIYDADSLVIPVP